MVLLYLQKPEVLDQQRAQVEATLGTLEDVEAVHFAGSPLEAHRYPEASVVLAPTTPWLPKALHGLPNVEWIHFLSAGVDPIWEMEIEWSQYRLSKSVGVHADTISEYVLGAILYVLKGFGTFARQQQKYTWKRFWLDECAGKTLGVVGLGTIGTRLAHIATLLGMRVVGTVTSPRDIPHVDEVYASADLARVLQQADFVVVLVPLTPETYGLVGKQALSEMKETAWLINVARGGVVREDELIAALQEGRIGGAVLDVFEEEPLPRTSPLWDLENVLLTPHVAGTTQHYLQRALRVFAENHASLQSRGELATPVSVEKRY